MKERPILFNGDMVRAILEGRKTQTRRPVKPQPPADIDSLHHGKLASLAPYKLLDDDYNPQGFGFEDGRGQFWKSPFGTVGDRLWVRETWGVSTGNYDPLCIPVAVRYFADSAVRAVNLSHAHANYFGVSQTCSRKRPSIHMPRWASRIDLEITRVWVERVQDISAEDCRAEGIQVARCGCQVCARGSSICTADAGVYVEAFRDLWQSIYGTWDANPWVWAYEFRRIKP